MTVAGDVDRILKRAVEDARLEGPEAHLLAERLADPDVRPRLLEAANESKRLACGDRVLNSLVKRQPARRQCNAVKPNLGTAGRMIPVQLV